jgi:serine/threonine-protein kinase
VPHVVGRGRDDAVAALEQLRLTVGKVTLRDGNLPAGQVLEAKPPAGSQERARSSVDLVVASGRVAVPDVRGRPRDEAIAVLRRAGLSVAVQPADDPGPPGLVIGQDRVGDTAERSSVVTIQVSRVQPPPPSPAPAASPAEPAATGSPVAPALSPPS